MSDYLIRTEFIGRSKAFRVAVMKRIYFGIHLVKFYYFYILIQRLTHFLVRKLRKKLSSIQWIPPRLVKDVRKPNMRLNYIPLVLLFLFCSTGIVMGKEIVIKEVRLSLYSKPVNGYRFTLDKTSRFVSTQIIKHVSAIAGKPYQFEKTIIFEHVLYPPITTRNEVTLYYILRSLPGNSTEVTMVAMNDYKSSINTKDYPDLSLKLLYDLSTLVNQISGDKLLFEGMVIDGGDVEQIAAAVEQRKANDDENPLVEGYKEEEVEHTEVLIKKDPFENPTAGNEEDNTIMTSLNKKLNELKKKEEELAAREAEVDEQIKTIEALEVKIARIENERKDIKDSLEVTRKRLNASVALDMAGDEISVSNIDKKRIEDLEGQLVTSKSQVEAYKSRSDSIMAKTAQLDQNIAQINAEKARIENDLRESRSENALLKADYLILKAKVSNGTAMSESGETFSKIGDPGLKAENTSLKAEVASLKQRISDREAEQRADTAAKLSDFGDRDSVYARISSMKDSIKMLKTSLADFSSGAGTQSQLQKELDAQKLKTQQKDDDLSQTTLVLQEKNAELIETKNKLAESQQLNEELQNKLKGSLASLKNVESSSGGMLDKMEDYQMEMQKVKNNLEQVQIDLDQSARMVQVLRDSSFQARKKYAEEKRKNGLLATQNSNNEQNLLELQAELKEKDSQAITWRDKANLLESRLDSMNSEQSRPLSDQENYLRDQRSRLDQTAKDLEKWKKEMDDREKLLSQRESTTDQRLTEAQSLEKRYKDVVSRENKLKALEQKIKQMGGDPGSATIPTVETSPTPPASVPTDNFADSQIRGGFSPATAMEIGREVPVFSFVSELTYKKTQRQIVGYMNKLGQLYDDKYPNLVYSNVLATELGSDRWDIRFRLEARGTGTAVRVSFKGEDGNFTDLDDSNDKSIKIKQFLNRMFSYRF